MIYRYKTEPYEHQRRETEYQIKWLCSGKAYGALLMGIGSGKTKTAIDIATYLYDQGRIDSVLLVAPNGIQNQWADTQIPLHSAETTATLVWNNSKSKKFRKEFNDFLEDFRFRWLCVNVDRFSSLENKEVLAKFIRYVKNNKTLIILDESTTIKNPSSTRSKVLCSLGEMAEYRYILTGSAVTNSPFDLYAQIEFLRKGFWNTSYFMFKKRYGLMVSEDRYDRPLSAKEMLIINTCLRKGMPKDEIIKRVCVQDSVVDYIDKNPGLKLPYRNIEELKKKIVPFSSIVKTEDCVDLPDAMYQEANIDMNGEQRKVYDDLVRNMMAECEGQELEVTHKLTLLMRLQQVAGGFFPGENECTLIGKSNSKVDFIVKDLEEVGDMKCIIWSRFRAECMELEKCLSKAYPYKIIERYDGSRTSDEKRDVVRRAQSGEVDILIMNPQSGAMGLNLQEHFFRNYFFSNHFSLTLREQAEGRTHRMGARRKAQFIDLVSKDTVDKKVISILKSKQDLSNYFKTKDLKDFVK